MIKKTVERIVRKKMLDWIESLPKELQDLVKYNILVSGGCIASLFRQEKVNDFDVYFKDINVLVQLCSYYQKEFHIPPAFDGRKQMEYIKEYIKEKGWDGKAEEYLEKGQYDRYGKFGDASAGFVQILNLSDERVKMNVPGWGYPMEYKDIKEEDLPKYRPLFISPNAISLSDDVQIVTRFTGTPEEIHKNYDFIHATNYFDFKDGLVLNLDAMTCLITSELKYQGSRYPLTSILRAKKFVRRNWKINAGEMLKIMFQISKLDLEDPNVLEEQLIGVDVAYFSLLVEIVRGQYTKKQDFKLTEPWLFEWIEKVFNRVDENDEEPQI